MHDFELRRRVPEQPVRAGDVSRGEDEAVRARGERGDEVAQDAAKAREALERAELEDLVQQERRGAATRRARPLEEGERRVERLAGAGLFEGRSLRRRKW